VSIQVTIVGNLTRDPEVKVLNGGKSVTTLSVAVNERVQRNGEWVDGETTYYRVSVFGQYGEALADKARKGDLVVAPGTLKIGSYEKDGVKHTSVDVTAYRVGVVPRPDKPQQASEGRAAGPRW
jgi:single-strand DNA-binding protein